MIRCTIAKGRICFSRLLRSPDSLNPLNSLNPLTRSRLGRTNGADGGRPHEQNLGFSLAVIGTLVVATLTRGIPPLGVIGHEGSTVIVVLNGLRLLRTGSWVDRGPRTSRSDN
jgi:hypothetical protein